MLFVHGSLGVLYIVPQLYRFYRATGHPLAVDVLPLTFFIDSLHTYASFAAICAGIDWIRPELGMLWLFSDGMALMFTVCSWSIFWSAPEIVSWFAVPSPLLLTGYVSACFSAICFPWASLVYAAWKANPLLKWRLIGLHDVCINLINAGYEGYCPVLSPRLLMFLAYWVYDAVLGSLSMCTLTMVALTLVSRAVRRYTRHDNNNRSVPLREVFQWQF